MEENELMAVQANGTDPYINAYFYTTNYQNKNLVFPIKKEKNFKVDDLETFLTTWPSNIYYKLKYISPQRDMTIKVPLSQEWIYEASQQTSLLNSNKAIVYAKFNYYNIASNVNENYYYFVDIPKNGWLSKKTITLHLHMDVLNTYGNLLVFDPRTKMIREHKDRFDSSLSLTSGTITFKYQKITTIDQNTLYKIDQDFIDQTAGSGNTFDLYNFINDNLTERQNWILYLTDKSGNILAAYQDVWSISFDEIDFYITRSSKAEITYPISQFLGQSATKFAVVLNNQGYFAGYSDNSLDPVGTSYIFDAKGTLSDPSAFRLTRQYDIVDEGLESPKYKIEENQIIDKVDQNWYIIFKTTSATETPLTGFICPENDTTIKLATNDAILHNTDITGEMINRRLYVQYGITNITGVKSDGTEEDFTTPEQFILFKSTSNSLILLQSITGHNIFGDEKLQTLGNYSSIKFKGQTSVKLIYTFGFKPYTYYIETVDSPETKELKGINNVNRTDQTINKIIKCPYCPVSVKFTEDNVIVFPSDFSVVSSNSDGIIGTLKFDATKNVHLQNNIQTAIPFLEYNSIYLEEKPRSDNFRKIDYESKLYHSSFYYKNLVYDSFAYSFSNELQTQSNIQASLTQPNFLFTFYCSNTMNSRFLVHIDNFQQKYSTENYENYLTITRNNEYPIYNNEYLNYMKTGYNYEVKAKNLSYISRAAGVVGGTIGAVEKFATGQPISGGISLASTLTNAITSTISSEMAFQQKQVQLQHQKTSVETSDDIDLLEYYTRNRFKLCTYQVSDEVRKQLYDLFFYCGYRTEETKIPNTTSRIWFNFVQCEPIFSQDFNADEAIIEEIKQKFREGCTYLHHFKNKWDWQQVYENYETWIGLGD